MVLVIVLVMVILVVAVIVLLMVMVLIDGAGDVLCAHTHVGLKILERDWPEPSSIRRDLQWRVEVMVGTT